MKIENVLSSVGCGLLALALGCVAPAANTRKDVDIANKQRADAQKMQLVEAQQAAADAQKATADADAKRVAAEQRCANSEVVTEAARVQIARMTAAAQARARMYEQLHERLRAMIDAKRVEVVFRNGRYIVTLSDDVLFASGKATLQAPGKLALEDVATALVGITDRQFRVLGHTDNTKLNARAAFKDNWELSQARAYTVTKYLLSKGLAPGNVSTGAHADLEPLASNATPEGRAKNRRTEIVLEPNLEEIVPVI